MLLDWKGCCCFGFGCRCWNGSGVTVSNKCRSSYLILVILNVGLRVNPPADATSSTPLVAEPRRDKSSLERYGRFSLLEAALIWPGLSFPEKQPPPPTDAVDVCLVRRANTFSLPHALELSYFLSGAFFVTRWSLTGWCWCCWCWACVVAAVPKPIEKAELERAIDFVGCAHDNVATCGCSGSRFACSTGLVVVDLISLLLRLFFNAWIFVMNDDDDEVDAATDVGWCTIGTVTVVGIWSLDCWRCSVLNAGTCYSSNKIENEFNAILYKQTTKNNSQVVVLVALSRRSAPAWRRLLWPRWTDAELWRGQFVVVVSGWLRRRQSSVRPT